MSTQSNARRARALFGWVGAVMRRLTARLCWCSRTRGSTRRRQARKGDELLERSLAVVRTAERLFASRWVTGSHCGLRGNLGKTDSEIMGKLHAISMPENVSVCDALCHSRSVAGRYARVPLLCTRFSLLGLPPVGIPAWLRQGKIKPVKCVAHVTAIYR